MLRCYVTRNSQHMRPSALHLECPFDRGKKITDDISGVNFQILKCSKPINFGSKLPDFELARTLFFQPDLQLLKNL